MADDAPPAPPPPPAPDAPPPPPAPNAPPPPPPGESAPSTLPPKNPGRAALLDSINGFKKTGLKKAKTNDRSGAITSRSSNSNDDSGGGGGGGGPPRGGVNPMGGAPPGLGNIFASGVPKLKPSGGPQRSEGPKANSPATGGKGSLRHVETKTVTHDKPASSPTPAVQLKSTPKAEPEKPAPAKVGHTLSKTPSSPAIISQKPSEAPKPTPVVHEAPKVAHAPVAQKTNPVVHDTPKATPPAPVVQPPAPKPTPIVHEAPKATPVPEASSAPKTPKFCTECGVPVKAPAKFCTSCGYKF